MANQISAKDAEAAYKQAVRVWNKEATEADARNILVDEFGMNNASASDMIRNLAQLLKGEVYHRTLSELTTRIYFDLIIEDFGLDFLRNAIESTNAHVAYYEALPTGGNRPGLRKLCLEYENLLGSSRKLLDAQPSPEFQNSVKLALQDTAAARQARLRDADPNPTRFFVRTIAYRRNADVVAERLFQANGICDHCKNPSPFERKGGGPYLEVHHRIPLAEYGDDVLSNTMALCPNCHREAHLGKNWEDFRN